MTASRNGPTHTCAKRQRNWHLLPVSISTLANGNPKSAHRCSFPLSTTHHMYLPPPAHPLTLSPDKLTTDLLTPYTFTASTTCCFLGRTSPSSSTFHKRTWTFSVLHYTGASHVPARTASHWRAQSRQFQLFKPSAPLDPFIQTNPIQSHLCLSSCLYIFILADNCTSVPATNVSHSRTFHAPPAPF